MTNALSTRQACIIMFISIICNKMLSLNSIIAFDCLNDTWIVFAISFVIEFLFILIFLYLIKIIDKPILQYVKEKFGKVVSTILALLIAFLFLLKTTEVMVDIYLFFVQLIYTEINRILFIVCFITIVYYFGSRKLRSLGRTAEILLVLIVSSIILSFFISIKSFDIEKLLPIFNTNFRVIWHNILSHNLWFGDFMILFYIIGNIKREKCTTKSIIWTHVLSFLVVVVCVILFTCAFGNTASMHRVSLIDITEFSPRLTAQGRFNWIVYITFPIALVLGLGIYSNYVTMSFKFFVRDNVKSKNTISAAITTACVLAICIIFRFTYTAFYNFVTGYMQYFILVIQYVIPIVLLNIILIKKSIDSKKENKMLGEMYRLNKIENLKIQTKIQKNNKKTLKNSKNFDNFEINMKNIDNKPRVKSNKRQEVKV